MSNDLRDYFLDWPEAKDQYVLVKQNGNDLTSISHCEIFHIRKGAYIYDEDGIRAMELMRDAGVPILLPDDVPKRFYDLQELSFFMEDAECSGDCHDYVLDALRLDGLTPSQRSCHLADVLRESGCSETQISMVVNAYTEAYEEFCKGNPLRNGEVEDLFSDSEQSN